MYSSKDRWLQISESQNDHKRHLYTARPRTAGHLLRQTAQRDLMIKEMSTWRENGRTETRRTRRERRNTEVLDVQRREGIERKEYRRKMETGNVNSLHFFIYQNE